MIKTTSHTLTRNIQKVLAGNRVSIPESIAKKWQLKMGDVVIVQENAKGLLIIPAEVSEREIPAQ